VFIVVVLGAHELPELFKREIVSARQVVHLNKLAIFVVREESLFAIYYIVVVDGEQGFLHHSCIGSRFRLRRSFGQGSRYRRKRTAPRRLPRSS